MMGCRINLWASKLGLFLPFMLDGVVSLVGSEMKVPIKILRDTAAYDSYPSFSDILQRGDQGVLFKFWEWG